MRTKAVLCAAVFAAGVVTSMAQSNVYSLNVVGYVNKAFTQVGSYYLIGNPLNAPTNTLGGIMPSPPVNTAVLRWNTALQDFDAATPTFFGGATGWSPNPTIGPGEGFFVVPTGSFTNTFVGDVMQGTLVNPVTIAGGGAYVAVASMVPIGGSVSNVLAGYVPTIGDTVFLWDVATQDFNSAPPPTWFGGATGWANDTSIPVGDGFFLVRIGGATTWTRTFTVQ